MIYTHCRYKLTNQISKGPTLSEQKQVFSGITWIMWIYCDMQYSCIVQSPTTNVHLNLVFQVKVTCAVGTMCLKSVYFFMALNSLIRASLSLQYTYSIIFADAFTEHDAGKHITCQKQLNSIFSICCNSTTSQHNIADQSKCLN